MSRIGLRVEMDVNEGVRLYRLAVQNNIDLGRVFLGDMYELGTNVEQNWA